MDLQRSARLFLAGVLLFLILGADAQAAGLASVAGRTTSQAPCSTYVPAAGGSGGGPCTYTVTVRRGDTVRSIARRCGVRTSDLATGNQISPSSPLGVGQTLVVPSARPVAPVPTRVPVRPTRSYINP